MWQIENTCKLKNIGHSDLFFVCLGLVQMQICVRYEGSMINHMYAGKGKGKMAAIKKYRS